VRPGRTPTAAGGLPERPLLDSFASFVYIWESAFGTRPSEARARAPGPEALTLTVIDLSVTVAFPGPGNVSVVWLPDGVTIM
jgi:hypothetical protein